MVADHGVIFKVHARACIASVDVVGDAVGLGRGDGADAFVAAIYHGAEAVVGIVLCTAFRHVERAIGPFGIGRSELADVLECIYNHIRVGLIEVPIGNEAGGGQPDGVDLSEIGIAIHGTTAVNRIVGGVAAEGALHEWVVVADEFGPREVEVVDVVAGRFGGRTLPAEGGAAESPNLPEVGRIEFTGDGEVLQGPLLAIAHALQGGSKGAGARASEDEGGPC